MVYVNSVKYACESCIKGHRSSNCHHNDRPLFEIKKKGRPVSQCDKCRELRQSKRVHGKCNCESMKGIEGALGQNAVVEPVKKKILPGKRFIPVTPSLPNGLKDALKQSSTASEALTTKRPVGALLNPCQCLGSDCRCNGPRQMPPQILPRSNVVDRSVFNDGLSALALVASCYSSASCGPPSTKVPAVGTTSNTQTPSSCCSGRAEPPSSSAPTSFKAAGKGKRKRSASPPIPTTVYKYYVADDFNSSQQTARNCQTIPPLPFSHFAPAPSISPVSNLHKDSSQAISSSAKSVSDCCCGARCECAGCQLHNAIQRQRRASSWVDNGIDPNVASSSSVPVAAPVPSSLHRTSSSASPHHGEHTKGCGLDCPTCVDHEGGVELPPLGSIHAFALNAQQAPPPPPSFIADYFARGSNARGKARSSSLPQNDHALLRRVHAVTQSPMPAKLEACCSGSCGCGESCGCGYECDGSCLSHSASTSSTQTRWRAARSLSVSYSRHSSPGVDESERERPAGKRSCCARD